MYSRNYLYVDDIQQTNISNCRVLIAGLGLGSNIAVCAARLGFRNFIIIDGDKVELSNLNRQHYYKDDIGNFKASAVQQHLKKIDPEIHVESHNLYLNEENIRIYVKDCDIVINTIDFDGDAPFVLDMYCRSNNIPSIHPFNFGWAAGIFLVDRESDPMFALSKYGDDFIFKVADHFIETQESKGEDCSWLKKAAEDYKAEHATKSPPQLAIASSYVAGAVSDLLFRLVNGLEVKKLPDVYFIKPY